MNTKGKLLLASFTSPLNHNGVGIAVSRMDYEMRTRGWDVTIATCDPDDTSLRSPDNYLTVPLYHRQSVNKSDAVNLAGFYGRLNSLKPDVIVVHSWNGWPFHVLMPYATKNSIPIFVVGHGFRSQMMKWAWRPPFFGLARWIRSWFFIAKIANAMPAMAGVVVLGKTPHFVRAFDHWLALKIGYNRIHTIPNAVKTLVTNSVDFRERHGLKGKLLFLCLAGYSATKDQLLLLSAFKEANISESVMIFIGPDKNDYSEKLRKKSESISASAMVLSGLTRDEVEGAIKSCDVAILGSRFEMQPIFLLEAMSEGKPWICPKVGAVDELRGGIVCHRSISGISDAIKKMGNPELRRSLGENGKNQWLDEFKTEKVYDRWDNLLGAHSKIRCKENKNSMHGLSETLPSQMI